MRLKIIWTILFCLVIFCPAVMASGEVIRGVPVSEATDEDGYQEKRALDEYEQEENTLLITKRDEDYIWESNEGKLLIHKRRRESDYFVEPNGEGFIKIIGEPNGAAYMEHRRTQSKKITLWGTAEQFNP